MASLAQPKLSTDSRRRSSAFPKLVFYKGRADSVINELPSKAGVLKNRRLSVENNRRVVKHLRSKLGSIREERNAALKAISEDNFEGPANNNESIHKQMKKNALSTLETGRHEDRFCLPVTRPNGVVRGGARVLQRANAEYYFNSDHSLPAIVVNEHEASFSLDSDEKYDVRRDASTPGIFVDWKSDSETDERDNGDRSEEDLSDCGESLPSEVKWKRRKKSCDGISTEGIEAEYLMNPTSNFSRRKRKIKIYVSGGPQMMKERQIFMTRVFPRISSLARSHSLTLEIVDGGCLDGVFCDARRLRDALSESAATAFVAFVLDETKNNQSPPLAITANIMTKLQQLLLLEIVACEAVISHISAHADSEITTDAMQSPKKVRFSDEEVVVNSSIKSVRALRKKIRRCQKTQTMLKKRYERDDNAIPACFLLKDFATTDAVGAKNLADVIQKYVRRVQDDPEMKHWQRACLEHGEESEIVRALNESNDPKSNCLVFYRSGAKEQDFFTSYGNNQQLLDITRAKLGCDGVMQYRLTPDELSKFSEGKAAKLSGSNSRYPEKVEFDLYNAVALQINKAFEADEAGRTVNDFEDDIAKEHLEFARQHCKGFVGREKTLQDIRKYLISEYESAPLAVIGEAGCGLSSVMSMASTNARKWVRNRSELPDIRFRKKNRGTVVLFRSVGVTAESRSIKQLIFDICNQLRKVESLFNFMSDKGTAGEQGDIALGSVQRMATIFKETLFRLVKNKTAVVIMIDNLQAALEVKGNTALSWLPKPLPKFVKIVLSFSCDDPIPLSCENEPRNMMEAYVKLYKNKSKFTKVQRLSLSETLSTRQTDDVTQAGSVLQSFLQRHNRTLTKRQSSMVLQAIKRVPLPLALDIVTHTALSWHSFTPEVQCREDLKDWGTNIREFCATFLAAVGRSQDLKCFQSVLCFVTCARNGLTHEEIVELVARDKRFHACNLSAPLTKQTNGEISPLPKASKKPHKRLTLKPKAVAFERCQSVFEINAILYKLLDDLGPYLTQTTSDGAMTLKWRHAVFSDAVLAMYMPATEGVRHYHRIMLSYFSNKHAECRCGKTHDCNQPLQWTTSSKTTLNFRRLSESIYHARKCDDLEVTKSEMLFDIAWLQAKLKATSIEFLMDEMCEVLMMKSDDDDVKLLLEALYLSHAVLARDPNQLCSQLLGRLHDTIERDVPLAPEDPRKYPYTRILLYQIRRRQDAFLVPTTTCLTSGKQVIYDPLHGHGDVITALTSCTDGQRIITASKDATIKIWDVVERRVLRTIENAGNDISSMYVCMGNYYVATIHKQNHVNVWNVLKCNKVLAVKDYAPGEKISITVASDGQLLAIVSKQSANARIWDLDKLSFHKSVSILPEKGNCPELTVPRSGKGNYTLIGYKGQSEAIVVNLKRGNVSRALTCENGRITQVEVSREYYIVGCRQKRMEVHELQHFYLFDAINYSLVRILKACADDTVFDIFVNRLGSHLIGLSSNAHGMEEVVVWNMESDAHRHMVQGKKRYLTGTCTDLQYCLTAFKSESFVRIHNLAAQISKHDHSRTQVRKKVDGIGRLFNMPKHKKYVVAQGTSGSPITIWNVARSRCRGEAVIIERGLLDKNDVVVVKDVMVVILSDRGVVTINHSSQQVFETIYVYNLLLRKYERKLHPVKVNMSAPDHYHLIGDDKLLSTSIERTSLTVWSIITGEVLYEILPNFPTYRVEQKPKKRRGRRNRTTVVSEKSSDRDSRKKRTSWKRCRLSEEEKQRAIFEMVVSADDKTMVCSYYSRHLAVFDLENGRHCHTLSDRHSLLQLHKAIITPEGGYLLCTNYDTSVHSSYLTLWDLGEGCVARRKRDEPRVCSTAMTDDATRVVFVTEDNYIKIWDPFRRRSHRAIAGCSRLNVRSLEGDDSQPTTIFITSEGKRAILFANSISVWDLDKETLLMVFEPDTKFQCCTVALGGRVVAVGRRDSPSITTLRVSIPGQTAISSEKDRFGEKVESSDDSTLTEDSDEAGN